MCEKDLLKPRILGITYENCRLLIYLIILIFTISFYFEIKKYDKKLDCHKTFKKQENFFKK